MAVVLSPTSSEQALADLIQLGELIQTSIATLAQLASSKTVDIPSLHAPFDFPQEGRFRANTAAAKAANVIGAAAHQLAAMVTPPHDEIMQTATAHSRTAALRVCVECHVPELLREAGPKGLSVREIGQRCGVDAGKLGRLLRALTNRHIFREVSPDVFATNRLSSLLDTGKAFEDLKADPTSKHDTTYGFVALVEYFLGDGLKSSAALLENMLDPETAFSGAPNHAPVQRALDTDLDLFQFLDLPEQAYRLQRFNIAMGGVKALEHPSIIQDAYDWAGLPEDGIVLDVGGGIGNASLSIAQTNEKVKIVVQDVAPVAEAGKEFWTQNLPEAFASGRVGHQVHDFFGPQSASLQLNDYSQSVFLLKNILHDWSTDYNLRILRNLRAAAVPGKTVLVVVGNIMDYTCRDAELDLLDELEEEEEEQAAHGHAKNGFAVRKAVEGAVYKQAPKPLLPNYGVANEMAYNLDLAMMNWHNAQEYTVDGLADLLERAGWRLLKINRRDPPGNFLGSAQAVPI